MSSTIDEIRLQGYKRKEKGCTCSKIPSASTIWQPVVQGHHSAESCRKTQALSIPMVSFSAWRHRLLTGKDCCFQPSQTDPISRRSPSSHVNECIGLSKYLWWKTRFYFLTWYFYIKIICFDAMGISNCYEISQHSLYLLDLAQQKFTKATD